MRVLHFYKTALPDTLGGVEQVIYQLASGASEFGVESQVLSLASDKSERAIQMDGYLSHRAHLDFEIASVGFSASVFRRFRNLANEADLIHYHFPWPFMDIVHFATRLNKPCLLTYHSDIIRQKKLLMLYRPLMSMFLNSMDKIVATSPNYLATSDVLAEYKDKVSIIPIGIDKTTYPAASPERLAYWRDKIGPKFFLFVGVFRYYKGLHILIEAARDTHFPIVIVGAGPIENELKKQASALGLHSIHFLGRLSDEDKVALLELCYGVVFPSHLRSEAFGISLLEGAMMGKPMISSEIGTGTSYINIADETGLVVPPSDPLALREAMTRLWENPSLAAEMGQRAQQRYYAYFKRETMIGSYVDIYRSLVD